MPTPPRLPQKVDLHAFLNEDGSNLALVLNDLQNRPPAWKKLVDFLRRLYGGIENLTTRVDGSTIQVYFHEGGLNEAIPATRLSNGTLRFLGLLAILCHPEPPPVVCIEEPELGLHSDALGIIGELFVDASARCQLLVTTHSDALVSALSVEPESVLVFDRPAGGTLVERVEMKRVQSLLAAYSLGDLWRIGELGGNP